MWDRIDAELGLHEVAPGEHLLKPSRVVFRLRPRIALPAVAAVAAAAAAVLGVSAVAAFPGRIPACSGSWLRPNLEEKPSSPPSNYLGMYALFLLVFGFAFTYPVVLVFLEVIGVVSSATLRRWRRYAIVVLVGAAGLIDPSNDPFSFLALAVPLLAFYEASILIGRAFNR